MICNDCGAQLEDGLKQCPYCGAHNFSEDLKSHKETVDDYRRKEFFWKSLPERLAKKGIKLTTVVIVGILLIGILAIGIAGIVGRVRQETKYSHLQDTITKLETLYQQGDYAAVAQTYDTSSERGNQLLDKYYAIYLMDMYHGFATRDFEMNLQHASEYDSSLFLESQMYWMKVLEECDTCEANGYLYEEQDAVAYYRNEVNHYLIEELHLTQEDVDSLYEQYKQIDTPEKRETFEQDMADYVLAVYMKSLQ